MLGTGCSTYNENAVVAAIQDAGLVATPLREWCINYLHDKALRDTIANSTLYLTLEPCKERKGSSLPPITQLIEASGIPRVIIGYEGIFQFECAIKRAAHKFYFLRPYCRSRIQGS